MTKDIDLLLRESEIAVYGCTVEEMEQAVHERVWGPFNGDYIEYALHLIRETRSMVISDDFNLRYDAKQQLNRALWVLDTFVNK